MGRPAITVVIPAYQASATVAGAVRTTLAGLSDRDRVLVRDDGSTDNTGEVVRAIGDSRVRVIYGPNIGVALGSQLLLDEVETPWVARMDADDLSLPWRFHVASTVLEARGCDVMFSSAIVMPSTGGMSPRNVPFRIGIRSFPLHLLVSNPVAHATMLGRTEVLRAVGGYRAAAAEDYDLWLRLACHGVPMLRVGLPLLRYRYSDSQVTSRPEWPEKIRNDGLVGESYRALSQQLLGLDGAWFPELTDRWHGGSAQTSKLVEFSFALREQVERLPLASRGLLKLKLRRLGLS